MDLTDVGRAAPGGQVNVESIIALQMAAFKDEGEGDDELVEHRYRLRTGLELRVALPLDLTAAEADRLTGFIRTLPMA